MLPEVGLAYRFAVTGVARASGANEAVDADEAVWDVSELVPSLLSDLGAGGAKYDFRLCRSIIETAQSCRSTGVLLAACRKLSLSYNSRGVGLSSGFFSKHFATKSSRMAGKASLFGNLGAGS
jgi:hypothetical protein